MPTTTTLAETWLLATALHDEALAAMKADRNAATEAAFFAACDDLKAAYRAYRGMAGLASGDCVGLAQHYGSRDV